MSLSALYKRLRTKYQPETEALRVWWPKYSYMTPLERRQRAQQRRHVEATFDFILPCGIYGEDEEGFPTEQRSGLVALTFRYTPVIGDAIRTAVRRERLQRTLLKSPLLGPSIMVMFQEVNEWNIVVLVAVDTQLSHTRSTVAISDYLRASSIRLYRALSGAGHVPGTPYALSYDPACYLNPAHLDAPRPFPVRASRQLVVR
jgi:hypothetical protein